MQCNKEKDQIFQDYITIQDLPWSLDRRLYSFLSLEQEPIQFGYEAEFQPHEIGGLLAFYRPLETWVKPELWTGLSTEEKIAKTREILAQLEHGNLSPLFVRKQEAPAELPEHLYRDDTKNIELRFGPTETLSEFHHRAKLIEELLGIGSLQAMVSLDHHDFFSHENSFLEHLGWLCFFNELDILERLYRGHQWSQTHPQAQVMKTFTHPFLGPMMEVRHNLLRKFLRENAKGEMLDEESLIRPRRREQSFKFIGSTAYRPDIAAPRRICFEIRDAHKDPELLRQRLARVLFYWQRDLSVFRRFSEVPSFNSEKSFLLLPQEVREWLIRTIPFQGAPHILNYEKPKFCYETYRNFSYPLRDWGAWLQILATTPADNERLRLAQDKYQSRLQGLINFTGTEAKIKLQQSVALFSIESGLFDLFRAEETNLIRGLL